METSRYLIKRIKLCKKVKFGNTSDPCRVSLRMLTLQDDMKYAGRGLFIRYARACSSYECFILRARRLSSKLLKQGYLVERLKSLFRKFYGRYGDLVEQYGVTLSRMLNDTLILDQQWPPYQSDFPPISWPLYRAWPSPNYEWFPWSICNGCG